MNAAELLLLEIQGLLAVGVFVFFRVGALMAVLPVFGERLIPARIRLAIAIAFTLVVAPSVADLLPENLTMTATLWLLATETAIGLMLGLGLRLFILALQTAGAIAAQATSLSQILGGASAEPLPAIGHILTTGAFALAVLSGLHVAVAELLILSYQPLPPGQFPNAGDVAQWGTAQVSSAFDLAFSIAAPFVILSALYNLTLGVINRAMPQLMVAFVGAPVITFGGVFLLFLLAPMLLMIWHEAFVAFIANPLGSRP